MSKQIRIPNDLYDYIEEQKLPNESLSECAARLIADQEKLAMRDAEISPVK